MPKYRVWNRVSGRELGVHEARNRREALETVARAAGYSSYQQAVVDIGGGDFLDAQRVKNPNVETD